MENRQLSLFAGETEEGAEGALRERSSTFTDNMKLPIHRWFRYSAGFSAQWVEEEIKSALRLGAVRLLDPFAGAGTALIAAEACGVPALGTEAHPLVCRIARAKLAWREPGPSFLDLARKVRSGAKEHGGDVPQYPPLIVKCYPPHVLAELHALKQAWQDLSDTNPASELVWFAITAILRPCSPVGTALWQYVLPKKQKQNPLLPLDAYDTQVRLMATDMRAYQQRCSGPPAKLYQDDARQCSSIPDQWANLVITSPPYANNYDYAYAPLLEMAFWGDVQGWSDLHHKVRTRLVRSCTQHVSADKEDLDRLLAQPELAPIINEIEPACRHLATERMSHGGKKQYHLMIAAYFIDLARVWTALRRVTETGCRVCFVIGDSAPYGVYVPVDQWLGELALAAGFASCHFEKIRDRNIKWRNRKHRVPLHEGRLWVEG